MIDIPVFSFPGSKKAQETAAVEVEPSHKTDSMHVPPFARKSIVQASASMQIDPPFSRNGLYQRIALTQVDPPFPGNEIDQASDSTQVDPPSPSFPGNGMDHGSAFPQVDSTHTGTTTSDVSCEVRQIVNPNNASEQSKMNEIIQAVNELSNEIRRSHVRLDELRTQICDRFLDFDGMTSIL